MINKCCLGKVDGTSEYVLNSYSCHVAIVGRYKLLAMPTAWITCMLAPLTFGIGLSLLGALPLNPHSSLNVVSSQNSVLCSLNTELSFTQSYPLTHF
jgi:hypothetical protein